MRQRHGAGCLTCEERVYYPFHPLVGKTVVSTGSKVVFNSVELVTIRLEDGTLCLTPAWMLRPEVEALTAVPVPRLCVSRLRAFVSLALGSDYGDSPPSGGAHAPKPSSTAGSVRRGSKAADVTGRSSSRDGGTDPNAPNRSVVVSPEQLAHTSGSAAGKSSSCRRAPTSPSTTMEARPLSSCRGCSQPRPM